MLRMENAAYHESVPQIGCTAPCTPCCPGAPAPRLDRKELDIICSVVRRTLTYRFRNVSQEFIYDAVQEAACRFYEQGNFRAEVNSRTAYSWILTAASRELGHLLRHEGRFVLLSGMNDYQKSTNPDPSGEGTKENEVAMTSGPGDQWTDTLTYNMLLDCLSHNLAEAVQLHFEGYTADEIAQHMGCTKAAAYKRVQRGCTELRQLWMEEEVRVNQLSA